MSDGENQHAFSGSIYGYGSSERIPNNLDVMKMVTTQKKSPVIANSFRATILSIGRVTDSSLKSKRLNQ